MFIFIAYPSIVQFFCENINHIKLFEKEAFCCILKGSVRVLGSVYLR